MKINLKSLFGIAKKLAPIVVPLIPVVKSVIKEAKAEQKAKTTSADKR